MVSGALFALLPLFGLFAALWKPRGQIVSHDPHPAVGLDECAPIAGLEACEDAWVAHDAGIAYLACSSVESRAHWAPSLVHLDAAALPTLGADSLRLFSFASRTHSAVRFVGLPAGHPGLFAHGLDALHTPSAAEPDLYTLFLVSHRPPADPALAPKEGADSVVELFETRLGSDEARYVGTVRHERVLTPNSVVATGPRSFYVSNDHARKVHWTRMFELVYVESSSIAHCELLPSGESDCTVAVDDILYPNGIAKGPDDLLYSASTFTGEISVWEIQADHTLVPSSHIWIQRPIDNLHVSPTTGAIFAATFPRFFDFALSSPSLPRPHKPYSSRSPVEIWRVANQTSDEQFLGRRWAKDVVLADPMGETVSAVTTAAPWRDQLLLTGYFTPHAVVCRLGGETL
ncbi:hypothetical protein Rhopal_003953-T1 [Rhodotorula paludigena]|uniref:Serum paraoxonase/arylesterase n=1 Tax=Rhodotorula paludigena TaxID=86838 RepID=A0AAV5GKD3_9BASI|nr:hypothetical protein Rhopal_003953-T1 [Rhodotorula paludigena]